MFGARWGSRAGGGRGWGGRQAGAPGDAPVKKELGAGPRE